MGAAKGDVGVAAEMPTAETRWNMEHRNDRYTESGWKPPLPKSHSAPGRGGEEFRTEWNPSLPRVGRSRSTRQDAAKRSLEPVWEMECGSIGVLGSRSGKGRVESRLEAGKYSGCYPVKRLEGRKMYRVLPLSNRILPNWARNLPHGNRILPLNLEILPCFTG